MSAVENLKKVVDFWFGPVASSKWWIKDPQFDSLIKEQFLQTYNASKDFKYTPNPELVLGHIILLDQFPRNMFRGQKEFVATDKEALELSKMAIEKKFDEKMSANQKMFIYMPFQHSEELADQIISLELFSKLGGPTYKFAIKHKEVIERFGRYPHRNEILGRTSTPEEIEFLKQPNSSF